MRALRLALADCPVYRIKASDSNRFVLLADPAAHGTRFVSVVEIFDVGGATPPNTHAAADEMFYVLAGRGEAWCDGQRVPLRAGDTLLVRAGAEHRVRNTGRTRLYCLTTMVPDEDFARLIRAGVPDALDAQDRRVLGLQARAPSARSRSRAAGDPPRGAR
jgi:mannose-6-phosphate isomerase-like protein (cupin superfamily)